MKLTIDYMYIENRNELKRYPGCSNVSIARDQQWSKMNRQGYSFHIYYRYTFDTLYILYYMVFWHAFSDFMSISIFSSNVTYVT